MKRLPAWLTTIAAATAAVLGARALVAQDAGALLGRLPQDRGRPGLGVHRLRQALTVIAFGAGSRIMAPRHRTPWWRST